MTAIGPICPTLALPRIARFEIRKQASPVEHFSKPASSAIGLKHSWGYRFFSNFGEANFA